MSVIVIDESSEADDTDHNVETEDLQLQILRTLRLILLQLETITGDEINKGDLNE